MTYVVGDAHHDYASSNCPEIHVGPIGFHKHESIGFNDSRNSIYQMWVKAHYREHFDYWGNTRGIKSCDGNYIRSDGYVAALETFQGATS